MTHKYNLVNRLESLKISKAYWGEIKDPVHGFVYITELEKKNRLKVENATAILLGKVPQTTKISY